MPTNSALRSPAAQNLLAAAVAGVGVLVRPARIPVWARRSLTIANTAGTAGSMLMTNKAAENSGALGLKPVTGARDTTATTGSALAAAAGSLSLLTSGIGLKLDRKAESYLLGRGVKRPRLWMAVGAIGLVFVIKTVQDAASRKAEDTAAKFVENRKQPVAGDQVRRADIGAAATKPAPAPAAKPAPAPASDASTESKAEAAVAATAPKSRPEASEPADATTQSTQSPQPAKEGGAAPLAGADAADAPGAAPASIEDTPIWKDVTSRSANRSDDHSDDAGEKAGVDAADEADDKAGDKSGDEAADGADVPADSADDAGDVTTDTTSDATTKDGQGGSSAYRPSRFEQQLAKTTPENVDAPREGGPAQD